MTKTNVYDLKDFVEEINMETEEKILCAGCGNNIQVGMTFLEHESETIYACDFDCADSYIRDRNMPVGY